MNFSSYPAHQLARRRLAVAVLSAVMVGSANAADTTYTVDADFALGTLQSVNYDAPNSNQLQVSSTIETVPFLYIANAGEDTLTEIDTQDTSVDPAGCEVARFRTWFDVGSHSPWAGPAPSRTAVDQDGNVYVANRAFNGSFTVPTVVKILADGGVDRNGNGVIDTSSDVNGDCVIDPSDPAELIPLVDSNSNGILEDNELTDERVAWIRPVGTTGAVGRAVCIDPTDGNIWVGQYYTDRYYKIDPDGNLVDLDGSGVVDGSDYISTPMSGGPYGCVVDGNGIMFSASLSNTLGVLDTRVDPPVYTARTHSGSNYGIGLGENVVYLGSAARPYLKYTYTDADPAAGTFSDPGQAVTNYENTTLAVSVDGNGDVVQGQSRINKYAGATDDLIWSTVNSSGDSSNRGVIPDADQDIWSVNLNQNSVSKFDGSTGNLIGIKPVGSEPYTYSDASGSTLALTNPQGRWTVVTDSATPGTQWNQVSWNSEPEGSEPAGTSITVEARAADAEGDLGLQPYAPVSNGGDPGLTGQFLQVRVTLSPDPNAVSPVLSDLVVSTLSEQLCDVDGDGDIDRADLRAISGARGQSAAGPDDPRDANGDGTISVTDVKVCRTMM